MDNFMIYSATSKGPFEMPGYYDPDSKRVIGIIYRPPAWTAGTVYYLRSKSDYDVVIPSTFNGFYYKIVNPGKSHATTEPTWPTVVGETVEDNGIVWKAVAYNLMIPAETISTSTWAATGGVTLDALVNSGTSTSVRVSNVPDGITSFEITNHIVKSNTEEDDITILFNVAER